MMNCNFSPPRRHHDVGQIAARVDDICVQLIQVDGETKVSEFVFVNHHDVGREFFLLDEVDDDLARVIRRDNDEAVAVEDCWYIGKSLREI